MKVNVLTFAKPRVLKIVQEQLYLPNSKPYPYFYEESCKKKQKKKKSSCAK